MKIVVGLSFLQWGKLKNSVYLEVINFHPSLHFCRRRSFGSVSSVGVHNKICFVINIYSKCDLEGKKWIWRDLMTAKGSFGEVLGVCCVTLMQF
jgi:hypothetical protein